MLVSDMGFRNYIVEKIRYVVMGLLELEKEK